MGTRRLFWPRSIDQNLVIKLLQLQLLAENKEDKGEILEKEKVASFQSAIYIPPRLDAVTIPTKIRIVAARVFQGRESFLRDESLISIFRVCSPTYETIQFPDLQHPFVWQLVILFL